MKNKKLSILPNQFVKQLLFGIVAISSVLACTQSDESVVSTPLNPLTDISTEGTPVVDENQAAVTAVTVTGSTESYTFNVTLESPDTGCDQYADWWEVFTADGQLIYRRILGHSHVDEQPFTRSGGPVEINPDEMVYIRAHMNNLGYGSPVFSGTIESGLVQDTLDTSFAEELLTASPLPTSCAF